MNIEQLQNLPDAEKAKIFAAWHALKSVESGMRIGLGTGSTASWFVKLLARARADGLDFEACATSSQTTELAESLGIKIESLDELKPLDDIDHLHLVVDGADEFDSAHNLIKGGGGALLQEKITARSAERFIVITDDSKEVETLGKFPLPVEIVRFAWETTARHIDLILTDSITNKEVGAYKSSRRMDGNKPFITDEGHYILDLPLQFIKEPFDLNATLRHVPGVVETGLFVNSPNEVIIADCDGLVKSREFLSDWLETRYELAELADMLPKK